MAKRPSIALRLMVLLSVGTGLLWIGAASIAGAVMQKELNESFDESMRQAAFRLLPLAIHDAREPDEQSERRISGLEADEEYFTYYVKDAYGNTILAADDAPDSASADDVMDGFSDLEGKRLFAISDRKSGYGIVVVERTDHRDRALRESIAALTWPLAALLPLIAAGIWFATRFAMRPVKQLSRDIAKRDGRDLSPLLDIAHPAELAPIADAVGGLLARLRTALDAERAFAASSAHELRTPIAGALAQVQRLAIELGDAPGSERVAEIEHALKHLAQLSEKLLQLSRLEAGFAQAEAATDLLPVLKLVVRDFQAAAQSTARVRLHVQEGQDLTAAINADAFAVAVTNLIQNALIHSTVDSMVDIFAGPGRVVRVVNAGPIVPAKVLAHIGERFVRGSTTASGTGLGLSIVRSIMEQTGGTLTLNSPATGANDGFEAVLTLG